MAKPKLPDRRVLEGKMVDLLGDMRGGSGRKKAAGDAQMLMYDAWDAPSRRQAVRITRRALEMYPHCADAYVLLAEETAETVEQARDLYAQGVAAGERSLGRKAFTEDVGHFWGILETRPYMRARAGLAGCLWALGEREAAVDHYHDLLRLNPNDNQGIRDPLATCLLDLGRDEELDRLLTAYGEDLSAVWLYTWALWAFRCTGDSEEARRRLGEAIQDNPHVPAFLLGRKRQPRRLPDTYAYGSPDEAILYVSENRGVWQRTPGALGWLARRVGT
jgi:tetratricopeptide (TPR) repeat protein